MATCRCALFLCVSGGCGGVHVITSGDASSWRASLCDVDDDGDDDDGDEDDGDDVDGDYDGGCGASTGGIRWNIFVGGALVLDC